ncbi:MAG: sulfotransferase [Myxococcales bacterium]|nr:sulfotransferase [Myxococcales bacterium]HIK83709.1 sulfotransferase [Myxococcales bacterium]
MNTRFDTRVLIETARANTGLRDFGEGDFESGLEKIVHALENEALLSDLGRVVWQNRLLGLLTQRLHVEDWYRRHPEIEDQQIKAPIFIVGLPRTGTTALSHLFACDPAIRSLRVWESAEPTPPPEASTHTSDPRIARAAAQIAALRLLSPDLAAMHEDTPTGPTEHQDLLGMSFCTNHFLGMAWMPSYAKWYYDCNMVEAYAYHRRVLKLLQWHCPPTLWHLKSPSDSFALDAIVQTYPDARFVMTHRDPSRVLASVCSLISTVQEMTGGRPDPSALGEAELGGWVLAIQRSLRERDEVAKSHFVDLHFHELLDDPLAAIESTYAELGMPLSKAAREAFQAHIAANPRGKHGEHQYALSEWGLDDATVRRAFDFYIDRCDVRIES